MLCATESLWQAEQTTQFTNSDSQKNLFKILVMWNYNRFTLLLFGLWLLLSYNEFVCIITNSHLDHFLQNRLPNLPSNMPLKVFVLQKTVLDKSKASVYRQLPWKEQGGNNLWSMGAWLSCRLWQIPTQNYLELLIRSTKLQMRNRKVCTALLVKPFPW